MGGATRSVHGKNEKGDEIDTVRVCSCVCFFFSVRRRVVGEGGNATQDARRYATSITRSGPVSVRPDLGGERAADHQASAEWRRGEKTREGRNNT